MAHSRFLILSLLLAVSPFAANAQSTDLTAQELAIVEAIKAKNAVAVLPTTPPENSSALSAAPQPPAGQPTGEDHNHPHIQLPEETKKQALDELLESEKQPEPPTPVTPVQTQPSQPAISPLENALQNGAPAIEEAEEELEEGEGLSKRELKKCLTVAFIDIDEAFNKHPRTKAVQEQIHLKITAKEQEVQNSKELIELLENENKMLSRQLRELKPFYERIVVQPMELQPKIAESADSLQLGNTLNRLIFSGCEILSTSPLNSPSQLDEITARIAANKKTIAERGYFIDNYKYTTREEILKLEEKEVKAILQDIYSEIKSFAKKRNIGAVVRKDQILYGEQPVNVTNDFVSRLQKSKKYRKK